MKRLTMGSTVLVFLLIAMGCTERSKTADVVTSPKSPDVPVMVQKQVPEQLTYDRVKANVKSSAGKRVVWRGKLVNLLGHETDDTTGKSYSAYYLVLSENPAIQGDFPESRPFLVEGLKKTLSAAAKEKVLIEEEGHVIVLRKQRWSYQRINDLIVTVNGIVNKDLQFHSSLDKGPQSAPLLSEGTIDVASDK